MSSVTGPGPDRTRPILHLALRRCGEGRASARAARHLPGSRAGTHDPRWPAVTAALAELRDQGRFAVRIVDADCGTGCLLINAVHHARALGFTAIEGHGIDGSPALIGRARAAADRVRDLGVGVTFAIADLAGALAAEQDLLPDIVLWHDSRSDGPRPEALRALQAGAVVICDRTSQDRDGPSA
ncbi:MAG TPA: SAM-dependent methyltransferase [Sphingomonas sp.]|jgi:SAM-dependent methyltransferase